MNSSKVKHTIYARTQKLEVTGIRKSREIVIFKKLFCSDKKRKGHNHLYHFVVFIFTKINMIGYIYRVGSSINLHNSL